MEHIPNSPTKALKIVRFLSPYSGLTFILRPDQPAYRRRTIHNNMYLPACPVIHTETHATTYVVFNNDNNYNSEKIWDRCGELSRTKFALKFTFLSSM